MTAESAPAELPRLRVAVIGGGLSGLAAAYRLIELCAAAARPLELTIFEAADRLGGVIGTQHIDGYLLETGADAFITNKPWAVDLCRRLNIEEELIDTDETYRRSLVVRKGKPVAVPEGFMLLSPAKIWPVLKSPLFSPWGKLRLACEYFVPRKKNDDDESLAAFVRRRFGRQVLERLVQPLVGGIYTSDPEKLSLQATLPRFLEMEREYRSLIRASRKQSAAETSGSGARYGLFTAPAAGMSVLLDALRQAVSPRSDIRLKTKVERLEPIEPAGVAESRRWRVHSHEASADEYDAVVLAVRSHQVAEMVRGFDGPLAAALGGIEYTSSAIVVSGYRLADIEHPLDAFGLVVPAIENREILAVSFSSRKFPGRAPQGKVLLRTFVGGAMQPELFARDDAELTRIVGQELTSLLGVTGEPEFTIVARFANAMPQYHVGHGDRVAEIERRCAEHSGLAIAGNAYHGVGIPDCIHSGEIAASAIVGSLPAR
ncbi:MAG: protoporphyrinogen oxidase [Planctomycetes bacterium]|nr:protoporphyrinogen oxidase [Planctomycetota bacterium]